MGFHKRFVDKNVVDTYLKNGSPLTNLFKADAFIFMDEVASKVYKWFEKGLSDEEIKVKLLEYYGQTTE
jgi:hypothetical protein